MRVVARLSVLIGDITRLELDAIVNAANQALLGGGGSTAPSTALPGPSCSALAGRCRRFAQACAARPGKPRDTGFHLPARFVIHRGAGLWRGGSNGEERLLASCYRRSLELASTHRIASVAFPAIS